jgi:zinc protease
MRVMNHILGGGGFSSMLMNDIREERGLTYGIYSQPVNMDYADYLMIQSAMSPENIETMMPVLDDIINHIKTEDIDADVLDDAKSYLIGSLPLRFSSTLSLSGAAMRMQSDGRSINALDEWADKINAVTADDVKRVANRIFESSLPTAMVVSGAVPEEGYTIVETIPGIE